MNRAHDRPAKQGHKNKIVEVACLKGCILPVVCETEDLSRMLIQRTIFRHPIQDRGDD
jgi:hypothetical protein